jgi:hypothetical protein
VNEIFDRGNDIPRIHPVIRVIGEEFERAANATKEEDRKQDFNAFNVAAITAKCTLGAAENPQWNAKLHMKNLSTLLKDQPDSDYWWWLPGEPDNDDNSEGKSCIFLSSLDISHSRTCKMSPTMSLKCLLSAGNRRGYQRAYLLPALMLWPEMPRESRTSYLPATVMLPWMGMTVEVRPHARAGEVSVRWLYHPHRRGMHLRHAASVASALGELPSLTQYVRQ